MKAGSQTIAATVATSIAICWCFVGGRAETRTSRIVTAANAFLSTLDESQRQGVIHSFGDNAQRARWSNFPTGVVPRGGIAPKEMTAQQQAAVMNLLATVLSPRGLEKVQQIRQADDNFKDNGSKRGPHGGFPGGPNGGLPMVGTPPGAGGPPPQLGRRGSGGQGPSAGFGSDLYYISFLGTPSMTNPWMLQFGGHHLALNITIAGTKGVMTPSLTGAQPATFQLNGKTIRPLGRESDKGYALLESLSDDQRNQAILTYRVADLVLGPGQDGKKIAPEGWKASAVNDKQRAALLDLIGEWSDIIDETSAKERGGFAC